jgi:hypothetical protein
MYYSGRPAGPSAPSHVDAFAPSSGSIGVAVSDDGLTWRRGDGEVMTFLLFLLNIFVSTVTYCLYYVLSVNIPLRTYFI